MTYIKGQYPNYCLTIKAFLGAQGETLHCNGPTFTDFCRTSDVVVQCLTIFAQWLPLYHILQRAPPLQRLKRLAADNNDMLVSFTFLTTYVFRSYGLFCHLVHTYHLPIVCYLCLWQEKNP